MATHYGSAGRGRDGSGETFTFVAPTKTRWGQDNARTGGGEVGSKGSSNKLRNILLVAGVALLLAGALHLRDLSAARTIEIQAEAAGRFARGQAVAGLNAAAAKHVHPPLTPAVWKRLIDSRSASLRDSLRRSCAASPSAHGNESAAEPFYPEVRAALAAAHGPAAVPRTLRALSARKGREAVALRALTALPSRDASTNATTAIPLTVLAKSALLVLALLVLALPALPWAVFVPLMLISAVRAVVFSLKAGRPEEADGTPEADSFSPDPAVPAVVPALALGAPVAAVATVAAGAEDLGRLRAERDGVRTQLDGLHASMEELKREVVAQQEAREAARAAEARLEELERRTAEAEARAEAATERATMAERRSRVARAERDDAMQTLHRAAAAAANAARVALHSHNRTTPAVSTEKGNSSFAVAAGSNVPAGRKAGATSGPVDVTVPPVS